MKQVHPDTGISVNAMAVMNDLIRDLAQRIKRTAVGLTEMVKKKKFNML